MYRRTGVLLVGRAVTWRIVKRPKHDSSRGGGVDPPRSVANLAFSLRKTLMPMLVLPWLTP